MPCADNCQVCNISHCLQCVSPWVGYAEYCLNQCPPNMAPNNGICVLGSTTNGSTGISPVYSGRLVPIPFSIATIFLSFCILLSKGVHP
jgi:hypothetical protein